MTTQPVAYQTVLIPGYRHMVYGTNSIVWIEGVDNYTFVHLQNAPKALTVCQTLKYFEFLLPQFIRANKSSLLNPDYIDGVLKTDATTMSLTLTNGLSLSVPRRRIAEVVHRLGSRHQ